MVDSDAELVDVWKPEDDQPLLVTDVLGWKVVDGVEVLKIELATLFG